MKQYRCYRVVETATGYIVAENLSLSGAQRLLILGRTIQRYEQGTHISGHGGYHWVDISRK